MTFIELKNKLKDFWIFSLQDIKKIDINFHPQRLVEWQDKGYIKKIINKFYIFTDVELIENHLFAISNKIYSPSYISLESALSYYNLIPEGVYTITSVSTKKTMEFNNSIASFKYRHIKPSLNFGYKIIRERNIVFRIASIEKTILDYFYLNPNLKDKNNFEELRFNSDLFLANYTEKTLIQYLQIFSNKSLQIRINKFIKYIKNA